MAVETKDKDRIFKKVRYSLGAPIRQIELTDEMLSVYLEMSIEDYSMYVQEWLIETALIRVFHQLLSDRFFAAGKNHTWLGHAGA